MYVHLVPIAHELNANNAIIKNMSTSEQTEVSFNDIVNSSFFLK